MRVKKISTYVLLQGTYGFVAHNGFTQAGMSSRKQKGKMRAPMVAAKTAEERKDVLQASKAVTKLQEYAEGRLTKEQRACLRGSDWEKYVDNYFARFGYVFPALSAEQAAAMYGSSVAERTLAAASASAGAADSDASSSSSRRLPRVGQPGYDQYRHCAHCLAGAMEENIDDTGYGTDPDVCAALDARRAWSAKQAAKQAEKQAKKQAAKRT
jgi:hypothetical protein